MTGAVTNMKKMLILTLIIIFPLILFACGGGTPMQERLRRSHAWEAFGEGLKEIFVYNVYEQSVKIGELTMTFETLRSAGSVTIGDGSVAIDSQPHSIVRTVMTDTEGETVLESDVLMRIFSPVRSYKKVHGENGYTVSAVYEGRNYNYTLTRNGETTSERLRMGSNLVYDNEMIFTVLRLAPLSHPFTFNFRVPTPAEGTINPLSVRSTGTGTTGAEAFGNTPTINISIAINSSRSGDPVRTVFAPSLNIVEVCGECDYCNCEAEYEDGESCACECENPVVTPFRNVLVQVTQGNLVYRLVSAERA